MQIEIGNVSDLLDSFYRVDYCIELYQKEVIKNKEEMIISNKRSEESSLKEPVSEGGTKC